MYVSLAAKSIDGPMTVSRNRPMAGGRGAERGIWTDMAFLLALLLLPILEIAGFILVGDAIGLWPTLLLVVVSGMAGVLVLRSRALLTLPEFRAAMATDGDPMALLAHGALLTAAGVLLVVPGFLTDLLALLLLVPAVRRAVIAWAQSHMDVSVTTSGMPRPGAGYAPAHGRNTGTTPQTIDVDYEVVEDGEARTPPRRGASGWTRPGAG